MRLFALSDLHVNHAVNRETLQALPAHPHDWLVLAGDLGEKEDHLRWVFETLGPKWERLVWVPGNHELYTVPSDGPDGLRGVARYEALCALADRYGVLHPEAPYETWPDDDGLVICPLFLLYDYSFAPDGLSPREAVKWAAASRIMASDETYLHPDPYPTREDWCRARLAATEARLAALKGKRTVLINHWPLRLDLVRLFRIPRFAPWCGTRATHDWHVRFDAEVVISGHLHMRATDWRDGRRFEEVSLGYPRHWRTEVGATGYLREILPGPAAPELRHAGPVWHR
ncbi:MAG: metallophosphoesterase [Alphaproteobacteria bacterium]|nr:metallophosphoesterase [Alphaproteobacteria bacterium]